MMENVCIIRDNMTAGCTGVAKTVIMKPFHLFSSAVFSHNPFGAFFHFTFRKAHGCLGVESGTGNQIAR